METFDSLQRDGYFHNRFPMQTPLPIPKPAMGKTFTIAISILGVIAVAELIAVGWALARHSSTPKTLPPLVKNQLDLDNQFTTLPPPAPTALPRPTPLSTVQPVPASVDNNLSPSKIQVGALVAQAVALRERGDTSTALIRLREALTISPDEPKVISELAMVYEKMGLTDKALIQWQRILDMGESAGIYYAAAEAKIKNSEVQTPAPAVVPDATSGSDSGSMMSLLDVGSAPNPKETNGVSLKIPVKANKKIEVSQVVIQVYFYDLIDNKSVVQTNANVSSHWDKLPADWTDSDIEILDVDYSPPAPLAPSQDGATEDRKYFGDVVRVYYNNQLQDVRAEPIKLLKQFPPAVTLTDPVK